MFSHVLTAVYFKFERFCFCVGFNAKFCDVFVDARTSLCYAYRNEQEVCFVIMFTTLLLWWILLCEEFKLVYTPGHLAGHSPPRHLGGLWQVRPSWTVVIHAYLFVLLQCLSELLCMSVVHGLHLAVLHTRNQHSKRVEKVARLHNSFVGSMSPVARCTCLCCRSSTQRRNLVCHLVARGCGMTGPCVLGANARFPTAYVGTSVCILRVWSRHVAARYLSVFVVHVPSLLYAVFSAHTHTYTRTFTHSTFTHGSITHIPPLYTPLCTLLSPTTLLHGTVSRTKLQYAFLARTDPPPSLVSFLPFPSHLHLSLATCWKKLTCGVIRSFICLLQFFLTSESWPSQHNQWVEESGTTEFLFFQLTINSDSTAIGNVGHPNKLSADGFQLGKFSEEREKIHLQIHIHTYIYIYVHIHIHMHKFSRNKNLWPYVLPAVVKKVRFQLVHEMQRVLGSTWQICKISKPYTM